MLAAGFALFLSVADNYTRKSGSLPLPPTVLAVGFFGFLIAAALFWDFMSRTPSLRLGMLIRSNVSIVLPFAMLAFLSLAQALHPTAYWGDDRKWIYLQTYDFFIFLMAMLSMSIPLVRDRFRVFVICGLLLLVGSILYEVEYPDTFSTVPGRAAGFPTNSNWGALVSVMICAMALSYRDGRGRILDLFLLGITGVAVYFTFSRSGALNFGILMSFYFFASLSNAKNRLRSTLILGASGLLLLCVFAVLVPMLSKGSNLTAQSNSENRLLAFFDGEVADDGSAADRMEAARETIEMIEHSPVFGHGTGFNRRMRQTPHNLYLKLWVDSGIFGLVTWLSLLVSSFWTFSARRYPPGQALVIATTLGGLFSHNILEQRTFLILLGGAAAASLFQSASYLRRMTSYAALLQLRSEADPAAGPAPTPRFPAAGNTQ